MPALPVILSVEGEGAVKSAFRNIEGSAKRSSAALSVASEKGGKDFARIGGQAAKSFEVAEKRANRFSSVTTALVGGVASMGLGSITNAAIAAGDEAENAGNKLSEMLKIRGQGDSLSAMESMATRVSKISGLDDDDIAAASAQMLGYGLSVEQIGSIMPNLIGQSRLYNQSLEQVANTFGKAYASGNAGALKKAGVTLSQADIDAVKAAKDISEARGQLEMFNRVQASMKQYALNVSGGLSDSQLTRLYAQNQLGGLMEKVGQSAGRTRAGWQGALTPIAERISGSETATNALGAGLEIGTQIAPILTAAATIGQALPTFTLAGNALSKVSTTVTGIAEAGPAMGTAFSVASNGLRTSGIAATFSGNSHLAAAAKIRTGAMTSVGALATVGVGLGALAVTAYAINETLAGIKNATTLSDEELRKKGIMGQVQVEGGNGLASLYNAMTGESQRGLDLDRQLAAINQKRAQAKRARQGMKAHITVDIPTSSVERAARAY